jgi:alpha-glucosidase (family GH31 glycosyl hydrolase)
VLLLWLAVYADGTTEYDAHNLFGTAMTMHTHAAAVDIMGKRPFMMVRWVQEGTGEGCV